MLNLRSGYRYWDFKLINRSSLYKYINPKVLILAQSQNQIIFVKYTSCGIVLCKNNVVEAIFIDINQQLNLRTDCQDFHTLRYHLFFSRYYGPLNAAKVL